MKVNILWFYIAVMILAILLSLGLSSMIMYWVLLELSAYLFLPVMNTQVVGVHSLSMIKYFVTQTPAAMMFLFSSLIVEMPSLANILAVLSLLYKLGLPPFHQWMISISLEVDYKVLLFMITVMKVIPLIVLSNLLVNVNFLNFSMMMFSFVIISSFNQINSLKLIVALSSIFNTYWTTFSLNNNFWMEYFFYYSASTALLIALIESYSLFNLSSISSLELKYTSLFFISLMNMSGLPPFLGFFLKLMICSKLILSNLSSLLILMLMSLSIVYLYLQIVMVSMISKGNKILFLAKNNTLIMNSVILFICLPMSQISYFIF